MKVRSHIALLVIAVLLPVVVCFTIVLNLMLTAERKAALRSMQELARASISLMDRELTGAMATAQALGTSRNLRDGDFAAFFDQARAANVNPAIHTALIGEDGQQVFNTFRPFGASIPAPSAVTRARVKAVLDGGRPVYSDLIKGSATGRFVVSVEVPVTLRDGRRFIVNEWMFADRLNSLLPIEHVPHSWLISVFDRQGITIARNISPERFVGQPPLPERRRTILAGFQGLSRAYTRDGVEMYGAWERSAVTGWAVGVGVPVAEIEQTAVQSVALGAAGFLIAMICALGGAFLFSRRLVRAIASAAAAADALAHRQVPPVADLRVDEMTRLQLALHTAGQMLEAGEASRQSSLDEARRAQARAEEAQRLAERQNRAKDEFLAMLGHELRNPLAAIASGVTILGMAGTDGERSAKARTIIQRQTRHLTHIVDELLDAHRILSGKITLALVPVDLKASVEACLSAFEARGATASHRVTAGLAPARVLADPTRLEQMVSNLVDNALKYTPEGGSVEVTLAVEAGHAVLKVADSGIGMQPDMLARAFDVFVQGKVVNRSKGGLGIGLAVVRSLADQHGAALAASSPGSNLGSVFTLRFPLVEAVPDEARPASAPGTGARVLVIEDNRDLREMMFLMLSEQGFAVRVADDGASGLASAAELVPDVALVDIDLPDMSGHEVARRLRAQAATAGIRLIAVTGYGQPHDRDNALAAGFDAHLVKPVALDVLVGEIGRLAAGSPAVA